MKSVDHKKINWIQRTAFLPSPFSLLVTEGPGGKHVAPYQLLYPDNLGAEVPSFRLHTKPFGVTRANLIHGTGRATATYGSWDDRAINAIAKIGDHRLNISSEDRFKILADAGLELTDDGYIDSAFREAFQAFDLAVAAQYDLVGGQTTFNMSIVGSKVSEEYLDALRGNAAPPTVPVTFGYRTDAGFVFGRVKHPWVASTT
jgi:hypothetical protein